jgi:hypothetical protein
MIARGGFQGTVSTIINIAGVLMISNIFGEGGKRKVLGLVYGTAHPLSSLTIYPPGNGGFQLTGPYIPFGIAAGLGFVSLLIIVTVLSGKDIHSCEDYEMFDDATSDDHNLFPGMYQSREDKPHEQASLGCRRESAIDGDKGFTQHDERGSDHTSYQTVEDKRKTSKNPHTADQSEDIKRCEDGNRNGELRSMQNKKSYGTNDSNVNTGDNDRSGSDDSGDSVGGDSGTSPRKDRGTCCGYKDILADKYVLVALVITYIQCVGVSCIAATSPNWLINVALAEQYQVGVIFGICGAVQLLLNLTCTLGKVMVKGRLWLVLLAANGLLDAALFIYPHCPSVWWALIPEMLYRSAAGIIVGITSKILTIYLEDKFNKNKKSIDIGTTCFRAVATAGAASGALIGGIVMFNGITFLPCGK